MRAYVLHKSVGLFAYVLIVRSLGSAIATMERWECVCENAFRQNEKRANAQVTTVSVTNKTI